MKKIISLVGIGLVVAALVPGIAVAGKKAGAHQMIEGNIAMQAPPSDATDNPNGCYSGVHRRLSVISQGQINGVVGFDFDIDKATWGKKFRLTSETAGVDIDITFYTDFGTLEQATDTAFAPATAAFETRSAEGEAGKVPASMTKAIVCMKSGQNADFMYMAGAGVK
jgi:hypothetical protein